MQTAVIIAAAKGFEIDLISAAHDDIAGGSGLVGKAVRRKHIVLYQWLHRRNRRTIDFSSRTEPRAASPASCSSSVKAQQACSDWSAGNSFMVCSAVSLGWSVAGCASSTTGCRGLTIQLQGIPQPLAFILLHRQQAGLFQTFAYANQTLTGDLQHLHQHRRIQMKPLKLISPRPYANINIATAKSLLPINCVLLRIGENGLKIHEHGYASFRGLHCFLLLASSIRHRRRNRQTS